jgi:hypothetical protein
MMRNASVEATTIAALELRPEPAGTEPVTRRSNPTGRPSAVLKKCSSTPCMHVIEGPDWDCYRAAAHIVPGLHVALPPQLCLVNFQVPSARGILGRGERLPVIFRIKVLCDDAPCNVSGSRGARDEDVPFDGGREDAKERVVDVFTCGNGLTSSGVRCGPRTYEVDAPWCACDMCLGHT